MLFLVFINVGYVIVMLCYCQCVVKGGKKEMFGLGFPPTYEPINNKEPCTSVTQNLKKIVAPVLATMMYLGRVQDIPPSSISMNQS